jgi:hypothetical protein
MLRTAHPSAPASVLAGGPIANTTADVRKSVRSAPTTAFDRETGFPDFGTLVEIRPSCRAVNQKSKGLDLSIRPVVTEDYRDLAGVTSRPGTQLARGLQTQMAVDYGAIASSEHRNAKAELAKAATHPGPTECGA